MNLELGGKTAVVTGASRGIGLAITRALVAEGVTVIAGARSSSPELDELGSRGVSVVLGDLSGVDGPARLVDAAGDGLDILINNVGFAKTRLDGPLSVGEDDWAASFSLNFFSAVRASTAAIPVMVARGGGSIVNVASVNALLPDPLVIDYSAAKAALWNYAKSLSKAYGGQGVRVNSVNPGPVSTELWLGAGGVADSVSAANGIRPDEVVAAAVAGAATQRFSTPEEVAALVVFLASPIAANLTGAGVTIDGGLVQTL